MSSSSDPWDSNRPDVSYYNPFPDGAAMAGSGIDLPPASNVGLFGGGYATWKKNQAANGTLPSPADFGAPVDFSTDGTGLPPSVTLTAGLPLKTDPFASLQQVLGFTNDDLGLLAPAGSPPIAQPVANAASDASSATPTPFNLYDMLHRGLNTPVGSDALQIAHGLSQGMEKYAPFAEQLGMVGAVGGAVTGDLPFAAASAGLYSLAAGMDKLGHGLDAGTSFLQSIQQDNGRPLDDFRQRMDTPGFYDLEFPRP